jgi:hypothetical protein
MLTARRVLVALAVVGATVVLGVDVIEVGSEVVGCAYAPKITSDGVVVLLLFLFLVVF